MQQEEKKPGNLTSFKVKRAVLYARTSSNDRATDSLPGQLEVCEAYAEKNGYTIVERLQEDVRGVKGDDRNAPALNRALEMAQAGLFDVLIIRDVKRYSRDVYKAMDFEGRFFDSGIDIEYVWNQELNGLPRRGTGFVMRFLQYWLAEEDRHDTVKKLYTSRVDTVRRKGSVMTHGRPPYGYGEMVISAGRKKRRVLVINDDEAQWVEKIFEWYVLEKLSLRGVARKLKEQRVPKPSMAKPAAGTGKRGQFNWCPATIKEILKRRAYMGEWEYSKNTSAKRRARQKSIISDELVRSTVTLEVPVIVSRELFEAAQERLIANKRHLRKKTEHPFLMHGRIRCGLCGYAGRCVAKTRGNRNYFVYGCNSKSKGIVFEETGKSCALPTFKRDVIDRDVWEWLKRVMSDDKELQKGYEDYLADKGRKAAALQAELGRIEENLADFQDKLVKQAQAITTLQEIGSTHAVEVIKQDILKIEEMINRYIEEKAKIEAQIAKEGVNTDIITNFSGFVAEIRKGMAKADKNFEARRRLIEVLNVTVELTIENEEPVFYPRCVFKVEKRPIVVERSPNHPGERLPQSAVPLRQRL